MDFDLYLTLLQDRGDVYVDMYMDGVTPLELQLILGRRGLDSESNPGLEWVI